MKLRKDLTDKIIGCWFIRSFAYQNNRGSACWNIECTNCGVKTIRARDHISKTNVCNYCHLLARGQAGLNAMFSTYSLNALKAKRKFELTMGKFRALTSSDCYYCGSPPSYIKCNNSSISHRKSKWGDYIYNGIDRKCNEKGYSSENCVSCCFICNAAKNGMSFDDFKPYITNIYNAYLSNNLSVSTEKLNLNCSQSIFETASVNAFDANATSIGQTVTCWRILDFAETRTYTAWDKTKRKVTLWKVECINCGLKSIRDIRSMKNFRKTTGRISVCRNCLLRSRGYSGLDQLYKIYIVDAKKRGMNFELDLKEFHTLTSSRCYYCNSQPFQTTGRAKYKSKAMSDWTVYTHNGIDRIDNSRGYTMNNCVPCCKICNRGKMHKSLEEFRNYLLRLCQNAADGKISFINKN